MKIYDYIIAGDDYFVQCALNKLPNSYHLPLPSNHLEYYPTLIRNHFDSNLDCSIQEDSPAIYQDQQVKTITPRHKLNTTPEEFFFLTKGGILNLDISTNLASSYLPFSLVFEKDFWIVNDKIKAKQLIWGASPAYLPEYFSPEFTTFTKSFTKSILAVNFLLKEKLALNGTLFIPTIDEGFFILEQQDNYLKTIHYFDKLLLSEEDISKRIKSLKRSLSKIFTNFSNLIIDEFLKIEEHALRFDIDDSISLPANLTMIGVNAILKDKTDYQGLLRGLKSLEQLNSFTI